MVRGFGAIWWDISWYCVWKKLYKYLENPYANPGKKGTIGECRCCPSWPKPWPKQVRWSRLRPSQMDFDFAMYIHIDISYQVSIFNVYIYIYTDSCIYIYKYVFMHIYIYSFIHIYIYWCFLSNESLCTSDLQIDIYLVIYLSFVWFYIRKSHHETTNLKNKHKQQPPKASTKHQTKIKTEWDNQPNTSKHHWMYVSLHSSCFFVQWLDVIPTFLNV